MLLLHLSDFHFGNKNRFSNDAPDELGRAFHRALDAATKEIGVELNIAIVIITGDIAESGLPSEFRYAKQFLGSLADRLSISPERFVIMPGNHDVSWHDCQIVRAGLKGERFSSHEFDLRLNTEKLANFHRFLTEFYGAPITEDSFAGIANSHPLRHGGWLRDFQDLHLSIAALNTSERENDQIKGGFLSREQAQSVMNIWRQSDSMSKVKIIALHHNPLSTTPNNIAWTLERLREEERKAGGALSMSGDVFQHYISDMAGFEGREHLSAIVKDAAAHLVLHGHHHDQGHPILWPWAQNGSAPVLSVGSFGLNDEQLPGRAPLSCQLIEILLPPASEAPRLRAMPLVYDGRLRLDGQLLEGSFRIEAKSRAAYDQPLPLHNSWKTSTGSSHLDAQAERKEAKRSSIPHPPGLYAHPAYIGSHKFVGRQPQLETLSDWASPADGHPILLFEAIGGTGKSILTWEWTTKHAPVGRQDWAGRVWYSFYEKGATMLDCCRRMLGYMTLRSPDRFREKNTSELTEELLQELRARPWLVVLDGLERVLVAYHRFDAAQIRDDEAGNTDNIARRDPCSAINPEDDDLLRALTGAQPSKILLTSRLIPRALLNRSTQPIPGVLHERLPGLRPGDAEALIRSCGIRGASNAIQNYLKVNCDCHPLVIGVLAGLINDYLRDRGNFDAWIEDPRGGGGLNLAKLDLVQKRNHILSTALSALPDKSRELLSTLALLSDPADYATLCALNPHLPALPEEVNQPMDPTSDIYWEGKSAAYKAKALAAYEEALKGRKVYEEALARRSEAWPTAVQALEGTVRDLEMRGLLQYDPASRRHDLHPVVRGISAGGLKPEERNQLGQRVIDHFSHQAENPYDAAATIDDFANARRIVNALFHMGELERAREFISRSTFLSVMAFRFEAHNEVLAIIRPFFVGGWTQMPPALRGKGRTLMVRAAVALRRLGQLDDAFAVSETDLKWIVSRNPESISSRLLMDLASTAGDQHRFALEQRLLEWAADCASVAGAPYDMLAILLAKFRQLSRLGKWADADALWPALMKLSGEEAHAVAAHHRVESLNLRGQLTEDALQAAERLNQEVGSALGVRNLCALRGWWYSDTGNWEGAKESLSQAVALAHKVGKVDRRSEIRLALARYHIGERGQVGEIADQLSTNPEPSFHLPLALLWLAVGAVDQAGMHAAAGYKYACGDGEPYVHRYESVHSRAVLSEIGTPVATMPIYDPAKAEPLSWEADVAQAVEQIKREGARRRTGMDPQR